MGQDVGVIGAGPMGLTVAYELLKKGHKVTLYEADNIVGGMSASFDFSGTRIERYYHFICTPDAPLFEMLEELGLSDRLKWQRTKMGYFYKDRLNDWGNPKGLLTFRGAGLIAKIRYGLHAFLSVKRSDWTPLDKLEATSWIKSWIGEEAYRIWWKNLFDLKFYDYATNLSAAWIWTRIKRVGSSRYNLLNEKLGYLEGGSETLLETLRSRIEKAGGDLRLSAPVRKVRIEKGKIMGVELEGSFVPHDLVVSTVPVPYVNRMIPDLPEEFARIFSELKNIAVVCVIAKLKKPVTQNFWLNVNDDRMDIPGIVEYTNLRPLADHIVYVPFYMPGEHAKYKEPDENFAAKVRKYLRLINPDIKDTDFLDVRVSRYQYAQPICEPGYLEKLPPVSLPVKGLYVADTSYYYPEDRGISESIRFAREIVTLIGEDQSRNA
ncbi:MAG: NAD(P)/FAD-dependent oxidoreductase [Leptospirillum sp.]